MRGALFAATLGASACASTGEPPLPSRPHVVFLDFADGSHGVSAGAEDDATHDVSQLCAADAFARWEAPRLCAAGDRDACRKDVLREVQRYFQPYNVDFTLARPDRRLYTTIVIAPPNEACTFGQRGVAIADCGDVNPSSLGMVFDCHADAASCAVLVAHEAGHAFGLVHSRDPQDVMTPGPEDPALAFRPAPAPTEANACGVAQQSSHATLLRNLGARSGVDP